MYLNMKIIPVDPFPETGGEGIKKNSSMIYLIHFKNLCKHHNVSPPNTTLKKKK
jgi:hypothetical protein